MNKKSGLPVFMIALDGLGSIFLVRVLCLDGADDYLGDTKGPGGKTEINQ